MYLGITAEFLAAVVVMVNESYHKDHLTQIYLEIESQTTTENVTQGKAHSYPRQNVPTGLHCSSRDQKKYSQNSTVQRIFR